MPSRWTTLLAFLFAASNAWAATLTPPAVAESAAAEYPAAAAGETREVTVVVRVDAEGRVVEAWAEPSADDAITRAAVEAAKKYRFVPAARDGVAIPSKTKVKIEVTPPAAPAPPSNEPSATSGTSETTLASADEPLEEVRVQGATLPGATRRTMDRREIETMPGTGGDALRTVESLPGVARAPAFSGLLIVRGSAPQDTQVFVDHASVPLAFHFGGLASIIPTEMLERIDVYPGNYDAMFGRGLGGIVDVGLRSPAKDGVHALGKVDLLDARALVETPLDAKTRVLVGARRSWIDAWLPSVASNLSLGVVAAPVYYDYQAILERDLSDRAKVRASFIGSSDSLALTLPPQNPDATFTGSLTNSTSFWRALVRADGKLEGGSRWSASTSVGHDTFSIGFGRLYGNDDVVRASARAELDARLGSRVRTRFGVDVEGGQFDFDLVFPPVPTAGEPDIGPIYGRAPLHQSHRSAFVDPAAYAVLDAFLTSRWNVVAGLRAEGFSDVPQVLVEPRLLTRYTLSEDAPRMAVKAAAGLFAQKPQPYENDAVFGTPGIGAQRAAHASTGVEVELFRQVELSVEPFAKSFTDLVSRRPDPASSSGFRYGNEQTGFAYGTEFLLKYKPDARFWGWLVYTISRSERRPLPEEPLSLFQYDQTHVLSALGSARLGAGFELGMRVRYVTGSPYTRVLGGAFDADAGAYSPIEQRPLFASRLPPFFSLDVRLEKGFDLGKRAKMAVYLDVQNATNRRNVEAIGSNFDFSREERVNGLPLLPILGVRGEI